MKKEGNLKVYPFNNREMMIDGLPNRHLYFYQKDIVDGWWIMIDHRPTWGIAHIQGGPQDTVVKWVYSQVNCASW